MNVIIGSTAIKYYYPDFNREPKDLDIVTENVSQSNSKAEYLKNDVLIQYLKNNGLNQSYLSPDLLLTLKCSHIFWNINFDKHMYDIQFLLKKGNKINIDLFYDLYKYWNVVHGVNKRSKLDMSADKFFDNAVKCEHNHDYLHTLLNPSPTYLKVLKDGAEVDVSETKFNALNYKEKCDLVREEVMVMAYERMFHTNYRINYHRMLKKFLMNHAPMWEAIFIIENWIELHKPEYNYINKINNQLNGTDKRSI